MNTSELAELFLTSLYDRAEAEGHTQLFYLNDFAVKMGVYDIGKITKAANILERRGYIHPVSYDIGGGVRASISGEGCYFVERGGETGIISRYRANPQTFITINQSTNIQGDVSNSNIATHSRESTQTIYTGPEIGSIIDQLVTTLKSDLSVSPQVKEDLLHDVESLESQLAKNNKDKNLIERILSNLSSVSSIASLVLKLKDLLEFP